MAGVGMAANVVGGVLQSIAASQEAKAMQRAYQQELQKQTGYQTQAFGQWQPSAQQASAETAGQQMSQGRQEREAAYGGQQSYNVNNSFAPTARDKASAALLGGLRANLGAYGDWQHQQRLRAQDLQQGLGTISNFAAGDASVFPYKLHDAQHSMDELAMWGQLIASIGSGAQNYQMINQGVPQQQQAQVNGNLLYQSGDPNYGYYT